MSVEVSIKAGESAKIRGVLRLREGIRFANTLAPLRMTAVAAGILTTLFFTFGARASATTYYVSSSTGSDANSGTSTTTAWQTIAHVNLQTFLPGDSVLFKRGDVWNESLAPASSGSSGNPISFDAYGTGAAPNLTGYYAVPATAWVLVTGNAWKAPLPATYSTINFCLFGSIWGRKVAASTANLTAQWDFYLANGFVYIYSVNNPAIFYSGPIVPMALSNVPVININGKLWLTFQHFLVNWFDQYGVYVQGNSDHLIFANMEADSMIPQGTQPLGFYVNESAPGPGDIKIYNSEAHLNYDAFRFDGAATAIAMVNDKAYGNRDAALVDDVSAVTYSYCHFYASSLAVAGSTDVTWTIGTGPTAGGGNVAADTAPAVQVWQRYPAEITLTVDDAGMTVGADTYYANTVLPVADAASVPVGAAVTVGYPLAQMLVPEFQGWVNAGRDVTAHSMSHTYYTNTDALEIQYTGSGTAATLSISSKTLTITVTGASDSVSYNLAQGQAQGTVKALRLALAATGKFTATETQSCQGPYGTGCSAYTESALLAQDLADVSGQDVRTSVYHMQLDVTQLTTDEITLSRQWMTTNLTGLPTTPVYVYPGGYETTTMQGITAGVPYTGARGALKEDLGVKDTYASGFNVQDITSFGVNPSWEGLAPASLNQKIQALVWKQRVWGVPWGIFWHLNELTSTEITNLIQDFKTNGATIQTNTGLVNWLLGGTQETGTDGNFYYALPATSMALDLRPTNNSPIVDVGQNLGTAYALDINGVNQNNYGSRWEIGAHVYQGYSVYGQGAGTGVSKIGGTRSVAGLATLPQVWVNNHEGDSLFSYELSLPGTWVTGPPPGCTMHAPYWTGLATSIGLQAAINDIEACRTATGVGIALDIPPALYTGAYGPYLPQSNIVPATNFLVLRSAQDSSLPNGQTVCSHGIQDNLATSSDIGLENADCGGDTLSYQLGATATQLGETVFSLDDVSGGWTVFLDPAGSGTATATPLTTSNSGPSLDGGSMMLSLSGNSFTNVGWYKYSGVNNSNTNFTLDGWFYTAALTNTAALEFDQFQYLLTGDGGATQNTRLYFGTECVIGGVWDIWNSFTASWVHTGASCVWSAATWHHLAIKVHRVPGDISGSGSYPKMYFDSITLDGTLVTSNQVTSAGPLPTGWGENAGLMLQMDTSGTCGTSCTISENVDEAKFSTFQGSFALANGTNTTASSYNDVQYMWTAEASTGAAFRACAPVGGGSTSSNTPACISTVLAPDHWLIEDMEARPQVGITADNNIIQMFGSGSETLTSQYPSHIHFRKVWAHADWTNIAAGLNSINNAFEISCSYCSVIDSQTSQNLRPGNEGHSVLANGLGPYKINHDWFEGQSSGVFAGGAVPAVFGLVPNQDVEMRRNRFTFPYSWLGMMMISGNAHWNGQSVVRKNIEEFKAGQRILMDGDILENSDNSGGQGGIMMNLNVRNASVSGFGSYYQSIISDVTFSNNILRNSCEGFGLDRSSGLGNGNGVSNMFYRGLFLNNLLYNATATNPGCAGVNHTGITWQNSQGHFWQGTVTENGTGTAETFVANCSVDAGGCPGQIASIAVGSAGTGCAGNGTLSISVPDIAGGFQPTGTYTCSGGALTSVTLTNSSFVTNLGSGYTSPPIITPASGTGTVTVTMMNSPVIPPVGFQVLDINAGDPMAITMCQSSPALNNVSVAVYGGKIRPSQAGPLAMVGSIAWNGTPDAGNLTVTGPWTATANAIDTGGYCTLTNIQGGPKNVYYQHNTFITDATSSLTSNNAPADGGNFQTNAELRDSIFLGGGWNNISFGEGNPSVNNNYDTTSLTADHIVWPTRNAAIYTAYGNNPAFPVVSPVMYFPATPYCTGATPTSSCVGFVGAMSTSAMPLMLPDYHNFGLRTDSVFFAGNSEHASDETSIGATPSAIDAAQTQNVYVCQTLCGLTGPWPD
jgi:hypothetical protein